jgi:hypothetical protein
MTKGQHEAMGGLGAESCKGVVSSDDGESSASAAETLLRRHSRHAFIDLVVPSNSTCVGYLDVSIGIVWIAKLCGKIINQQSLRSRDGCRTLALVDSLYAAERGALMLRVASSGSSVQELCSRGDVENGTVLSIQEMWAIVINSGIGLEQYVVYRSLRDHGYSVFPQSAAQGALAVMHAVKAASATTVLVFSVRSSADTLMRCVSLLPGAELRSLSVESSASFVAHERAASGCGPAPDSADAIPSLVNGSVLTMRSACAAAVVDGTDVTWLGFDAFE